jgi:hypothetical protein
MPELTPKSTPPSPPEPPPPIPPPMLVKDWELWEGFRFTFLRHFTRPEDCAALRQVAQLLYDLVLERTPTGWPELPAPETRWEMVAVLAELRFLEGFLTSVFKEHQVCSLPPDVEKLSRFAGGIAYELSEIARRLNEELHNWRQP